MKNDKFQYHVAQVFLKDPLPIEEILEKLGIIPLLKGCTSFIGSWGKVKLMICIATGTPNTAWHLEIYADIQPDKKLQKTIQTALPVFTPEDFDTEVRTLLKKEREKNDAELWEKTKQPLIHMIFQVCGHPSFVKEIDRRIMREIGSPAYHSWAAAGRDPEDHVGALSRKLSCDIIRELGEEMTSFEISQDEKKQYKECPLSRLDD